MTSLTRLLSFVLTLSLLPTVSLADESPASKLAKLILDEGCGIVPEFEKDQWREAEGRDFSSDAWSSIRKVTDLTKPWQAQGDFNGDGLVDLAKVVVRKADGRWMVGVEFGSDARTPCSRFQIASDTILDQALRIPGVITIPRGAEQVACGQMADLVPNYCRVPADSPLRTSTFDGLLMVNDDWTMVSGYLWGQFEDRLKSDGTKMMAFNSVAIDFGYDLEAFGDAFNAQSEKPQPGDLVDAATRRALVQEFDTAFGNSYRAQHRRTISHALPNGAARVFSIVEVLPPDKRRTIFIFDEQTRSEVREVSGRSWTLFQGDIQENAETPKLDSGDGAAIGVARIVSVSSGSTAGVPSKTLTVIYKDVVGTEHRREIVIDTQNHRPLKDVDDDGRGTISATVFDYGATIEAIVAPE
jgi:hypothetical protein